MTVSGASVERAGLAKPERKPRRALPQAPRPAPQHPCTDLSDTVASVYLDARGLTRSERWPSRAPEAGARGVFNATKRCQSQSLLISNAPSLGVSAPPLTIIRSARRRGGPFSAGFRRNDGAVEAREAGYQNALKGIAERFHQARNYCARTRRGIAGPGSRSQVPNVDSSTRVRSLRARAALSGATGAASR